MATIATMMISAMTTIGTIARTCQFGRDRAFRKMETMKAPAEFTSIQLVEVSVEHLADSQKQLRDFWLGLCKDDALPARGNFAPSDLRGWLGSISLVDVDTSPRRFRWRLIGSQIAEAMGRDSSGRWFDDIYSGATLDDFNAAYSLCVDRRRPVAFRGSVVFVGKEYLQFRMLQLPLAADGKTVDMLMVMLDFDFDVDC